jgi:hypothetical protein
MKKTLILFFLAIAGSTYSQGVHFAFGTGTSLVRLEGGYSISEKLHVGGYFSPGFSFGNIPKSFGGYGRFSFEENDFGNGFINASFRGYVGADIGIMKLEGSTSYDLLTGNIVTNPAKTALGFSGMAGAEFLYGRTGKFGSFIELHLGKVPNYFNSLSSLTGSSVKISSPWGLNAGIRMYFGK